MSVKANKQRKISREMSRTMVIAASGIILVCAREREETASEEEIHDEKVCALSSLWPPFLEAMIYGTHGM